VKCEVKKKPGNNYNFNPDIITTQTYEKVVCNSATFLVDIRKRTRRGRRRTKL
jgi:hypothetical protein